jgi:3-carboxy-cis,cis-muconate cycloisomerase
MRANLDADGGTIMAEAAMMALAGAAGRADSHRLVSEASSLARDDGISLRAALEQTLAPELLAAMPPLERVLDPGSYLGESDAVVTAALEGWRRVTPRSGRAAGRAPS